MRAHLGLAGAFARADLGPANAVSTVSFSESADERIVAPQSLGPTNPIERQKGNLEFSGASPCGWLAERLIRLPINGPVLAQAADMHFAPSWIIIAILALLAVVVIFALVVVAAVVMARSSKRSPNNPDLIPCPMCNHRVSPEATMCAGCGHPLNDRRRAILKRQKSG